MKSATPLRALSGLREVDALAEAVYRWMRRQQLEHRFLGTVLSPQDEQVLAAGYLAGLRGLYCLEDQEAMLIAYAYFLKRGSRNAAAQAQELLTERIGRIQ